MCGWYIKIRPTNSKKGKSTETEKTRLLIIIHTCTYVPKLLFCWPRWHLPEGTPSSSTGVQLGINRRALYFDAKVFLDMFLIFE